MAINTFYFGLISRPNRAT